MEKGEGNMGKKGKSQARDMNGVARATDEYKAKR